MCRKNGDINCEIIIEFVITSSNLSIDFVISLNLFIRIDFICCIDEMDGNLYHHNCYKFYLDSVNYRFDYNLLVFVLFIAKRH